MQPTNQIQTEENSPMQPRGSAMLLGSDKDAAMGFIHQFHRGTAGPNKPVSHYSKIAQ